MHHIYKVNIYLESLRYMRKEKTASTCFNIYFFKLSMLQLRSFKKLKEKSITFMRLSENNSE